MCALVRACPVPPPPHPTPTHLPCCVLCAVPVRAPAAQYEVRSFLFLGSFLVQLIATFTEWSKN